MNNKNNLVYREQLDDNVIEMLSEDIGSNYSLRTENTKTIVAALNEILGKDIISNAVGSPLVFDDTFEVMGEKINGLTNEFKTKLITLGVSVSGIDKFETLIRKLDEIDLGADAEDLLGSFIESLSGVLEDEGVELSGNETLGELIIKVDEEFDRKNANSGLDIISATELPATGRENQICVITDNPVNSFITTSYAGDIDDSSSDIIVKLGAGTGPISNKLEIGVDNRSIYRVDAIYQSGNILPSYLYTGGEWVEFTEAGFIIMQNRKYADGITLNGGTMTEGYGLYLKTGNMSASTTTSSSVGYTELLDFSNFTKCVIVGEHSYASVAKYFQINIADSNGNSLGTIFGDSASAVPLNFTETFNLSEYTGEYKFSILVKFNNNTAYTSTGEIWIYDIIFM